MADIDQTSYNLGQLESKMDAVIRSQNELIKSHNELRKDLQSMKLKNAGIGGAAGSLMAIFTSIMVFQFKQGG